LRVVWVGMGNESREKVIVVFSVIRRRLCYANVVATLALVFAMSGGALAAGHYLLTSTSQVSPKVLKALKGQTGKTGSVGAQGAQGSQGVQGAQGAHGEPGAVGPAGPQGPQGEPGAPGVAGKEGSPWTAGGTLPAGKSETGAWGGGGGPEVTDMGFSERIAVASFAIPLLVTPTYNVIGVEEGQGEAKENERAKKDNEKRKLQGEPELPLPIPTDCKGTVEKPEATEGNLCVFVESEENVNMAHFSSPSAPHISTAGAVINILGDYEEGFSIEGTWAVTDK
jgi:Collagen triple helix repeat (20 copies)